MVKVVMVNTASSVSSKTQTPFVRMKGMIPDRIETLMDLVENMSMKIHVKALSLLLLMKFTNADCFKASQLLKMVVYVFLKEKRKAVGTI